ncbi:hypothetical protein F2P81_014440 [Scophthalmus maximus]|uniref:RNA polymerase I-specific transcription initiation factor RRN3 n=1 Tax=Scophthalmus maximus TaxID=52904 RepID=A0A6A4SJV6_SCOMX|nr:hypothetical protein F2P81_014440 [Scophthalmus maximus]
MEMDGLDFLNSPPLKTVRFGGSVVETLTKYRQGDSSDYELLKHQLADPEIKDAQIISWLQEFRSCVTQLNKDHEQLIYTVLRLPWVSRSQAVVEEYMTFLSNLVSAQTVYLCSCLKMVVSHFTPKRVTICEGGVDISDSDDEDDNLPRNFDRCHQALQLITRYVPATSRFLMPIVQENFPFVQKSSRTLECYVHNLLRMTVYIPSIRRDVLEVIIGKMLKLDVSASRSDIEEAEDNAVQSQRTEEQTEEGLFDMALAEAFLDHLWKILQSPSQPAVLRQAAAGFMGSFLARAKFVPLPTVRACLDLLLSWIHRYIDSQDSSGRQACCDISLHGSFYSACQAVFYTLIFRHRGMLEGNMKKGLEYLQSLNLERVVMCQLNPLKVCLPLVTNMFAAITRKYQVVFCYSIIERNNRHMLPVVRSSAGGDSVTTNTNPLDSFFPFDPYLLKREDEDDFLCGEIPQSEGIVGMTPSSYDSNLRSPSSVGSPPFSYQKPF